MDGANIVACVFFRNEKVDVRLLRSCIASLENSVGMKPSNVGKSCCGVLCVFFFFVCVWLLLFCWKCTTGLARMVNICLEEL